MPAGVLASVRDIQSWTGQWVQARIIWTKGEVTIMETLRVLKSEILGRTAHSDSDMHQELLNERKDEDEDLLSLSLSIYIYIYIYIYIVS